MERVIPTNKRISEKAKKCIEIVKAQPELTMRDAMLAAGYTEASAKNPQRVRQSKTWEELMDEKLPDDYLLEQHGELIKHADPNIKYKGIDLAYKIKGKIKREVMPVVPDYESLMKAVKDRAGEGENSQ